MIDKLRPIYDRSRVVFVGYTVTYRLFNSVDRMFYGPVKKAVCLSIDYSHKLGTHYRPYKLESEFGGSLWIAGKEVKKVESPYEVNK